MGVKDLWGILAPVMKPIPLADLRGQTLAIDLSIWVVETQGVKQMQGVVVKPHIRNLFFRINHLLQLGINLVFVIEGEPPELKWNTMAQRTQTRFRGSNPGRGRGRGAAGVANASYRPKRTQFKAMMRECCQMLDALGVPYVQAAGEAEAMCALLNSKGVVDACVTDDGDAFLYGARQIYRNFTMDKDPHVESYTMSDIERHLCLYRQSLVGLALILGCDYLPRGIPGVGKESALKFFAYLGQEDILERFDSWSTNQAEFAALEKAAARKKVTHCPHCRHPGTQRQHERDGCTLCGSTTKCRQEAEDYDCPCDWHQEQRHLAEKLIEFNIQKKVIKAEGFPWPNVVKEFLRSKDTLPNRVLVWKRPQLVPFILYSERVLEWVRDYSRKKVLPLLTLWDMKAILGIHSKGSAELLVPHSIAKGRVKQGVTCFEILWNKAEEDSDCEEEYYTTIEEAELFSKCFPRIVETFEFEKAAKPARKKGKDGKKKSGADNKENEDMNELSAGVGNLQVGPKTTGNNQQRIQSTFMKESSTVSADVGPVQHKQNETHKNGSAGGGELNRLHSKHLSEHFDPSSLLLLTDKERMMIERGGMFKPTPGEKVENHLEEDELYDEEYSSEEDEDGEDFAFMAQAIEGGLCLTSDDESDSLEELDENHENSVMNLSDKKVIETNTSGSDQDEQDLLVPLSQRLKRGGLAISRPAVNLNVKKVPNLSQPLKKAVKHGYERISVIKKANSKEHTRMTSKQTDAEKTDIDGGRKCFSKALEQIPLVILSDENESGASKGVSPKDNRITAREQHVKEALSLDTPLHVDANSEKELKDIEKNDYLGTKLTDDVGTECGACANTVPQPKAFQNDLVKQIPVREIRHRSLRTSYKLPSGACSVKKAQDDTTSKSGLPPTNAPSKLAVCKILTSKKKKIKKSKSQDAPAKKPWYRQSVDFSSDEDDILSNAIQKSTGDLKTEKDEFLKITRERLSVEKEAKQGERKETQSTRSRIRVAVNQSESMQNIEKRTTCENRSENKKMYDQRRSGHNSIHCDKKSVTEEVETFILMEDSEEDEERTHGGPNSGVDDTLIVSGNMANKHHSSRFSRGSKHKAINGEDTVLFPATDDQHSGKSSNHMSRNKGVAVGEETLMFDYMKEGVPASRYNNYKTAVKNRKEIGNIQYSQLDGDGELTVILTDEDTDSLLGGINQKCAMRKINVNLQSNQYSGNFSHEADTILFGEAGSYSDIQHSKLDTTGRNVNDNESDETYLILDETVQGKYTTSVYLGETVLSDVRATSRDTLSQNTVMISECTVILPSDEQPKGISAEAGYVGPDDVTVQFENPEKHVIKEDLQNNRNINVQEPDSKADETYVFAEQSIVGPSNRIKDRDELRSIRTPNYIDETVFISDSELLTSSCNRSDIHRENVGDLNREEEPKMYPISDTDYDKTVYLGNKDKTINKSLNIGVSKDSNDETIVLAEDSMDENFDEPFISENITSEVRQPSEKASKSETSLFLDETVISGNVRDCEEHLKSEDKSGKYLFFSETVISGNITNKDEQHLSEVDTSENSTVDCESLTIESLDESVVSGNLTQKQKEYLLEKSPCIQGEDTRVIISNQARVPVPHPASLMLLSSKERNVIDNFSGYNRLQQGLGSLGRSNGEVSSFLEMPTAAYVDTPDIGAQRQCYHDTKENIDIGLKETPKSRLVKDLKRNYNSTRFKLNTPSPVNRKYSKNTGSMQNGNTIGDFSIDSSLLNFSNETLEESRFKPTVGIPNSNRTNIHIVHKNLGAKEMNKCTFAEVNCMQKGVRREREITEFSSGAFEEERISYKRSTVSDMVHSNITNETACEAASPVPLAKRLMSRFTRSNATTGAVLSQIFTSQGSRQVRKQDQGAFGLLCDSD